MKKDGVLSLIPLVFVPVICMVVLHVCFETSCKEILTELAIAIFTGCILAIPSAVVLLVKNHIKIKNDLHIILFGIKKNVTELSLLEDVDGTSIDTKIQTLTQLHRKLESVLSENYLKNYENLNQISEDLLKLLTDLRTIFNLSSEESKNNLLKTSVYVRTTKHIERNKNSILTTIEALKYNI